MTPEIERYRGRLAGPTRGRLVLILAAVILCPAPAAAGQRPKCQSSSWVGTSPSDDGNPAKVARPCRERRARQPAGFALCA